MSKEAVLYKGQAFHRGLGYWNQLMHLMEQDYHLYTHNCSWLEFAFQIHAKSYACASSRTKCNKLHSTLAFSQIPELANHGIMIARQLSNPHRTGSIADRHQQLDIAMVQLIRTTQTYEQAEIPRRLTKKTDLMHETRFEVDGMRIELFQNLLDPGPALSDTVESVLNALNSCLK